jgi:hypothetical protein
MFNYITMKRFFGLKLKRNPLLRNLFALFLVILISLSPTLAAWFGFKNGPLVQKVVAQEVETFTASGTWTAPTGVTEVLVEVWGAGGGSIQPPNRSSSGGGGGGAYSRSTVSVTPQSNYSYTVGTASYAADGGDTYWVNTSTVMAKGGRASTGTAGGAGGAAASGVGSVKYSGGTGGNGASTNNANGGGGGGAAGSSGNGNSASARIGGAATSDYGGKGGDGSLGAGAGQYGSAYGGGAGGNSRSGGQPGNSAGADGFIRITYTAEASITVASSGSQTSSVEADTSDFHVGGAFTFVRSADSTNVTSIKITNTGTISDSNLSGLILYYKQEATCSTGIPGDATQFNSTAGTFSSGSSTVTGTMSVGTSQICLYVEVDIGASATNGQTVLIEISNPSTDVTASAGNVTPATAVTITGTTTVAVNQAPSFTDFSNDGPVDPGVDITFTATASDPDSDNIKLVVCKTSGVTGTECDGGASDTLCTSSLVASNPSCSYSIPTPTDSGSYNTYPYVFDSKGLASGSTLQGALDTYTVNNVAPTVSNVTINGGTDIDLEAGTTKSVTITGTVTDNNGCEDIDSVKTSVYRSGVGGEAEVLTATYYFDGNQDIIVDDFGWVDTTNAFDGNSSTYSSSISPNKNLTGYGTNAPSTGGYITEVKARLMAGTDDTTGANVYAEISSDSVELGEIYKAGGGINIGWTGYITLNEPSGGWTWQVLQDLSVRLYSTDASVSISARAHKVEFDVSYIETTTETYYFDASVSGPTDSNNVWDNEPNAFDGSLETGATTLYGGSTSSNYLTAAGTNIPGSGGDITQVRVRVHAGLSSTSYDHATADVEVIYDSTILGTAVWLFLGSGIKGWGEYTTLDSPSTGWTWSALQELGVKMYTVNTAATWDLGDIQRIEVEVTSLFMGGGSGCSTSLDANNNNCYPEITCTVNTGTCTGAGDASANYTCTVNLQYYADPTDANTQYPDQTWLSTIFATDLNTETGQGTVSQGVNVNSLMAFNITTEINYGSLSIGESNDPLDRITTITPTGNIGLNHEVSGPANMCTDFPICTGGTIPIGYQKYALSESTSYDSATALSTTDTEVSTNVPKPISHPPTTKSIWWGMLVPEETGPGTYDGSITIIGYKSNILNW